MIRRILVAALAVAFVVVLGAAAFADTPGALPIPSDLVWALISGYGVPALVIFAMVSFLCSLFCALTKTPAPSSKWSAFYQVIEALALLTRNAKMTGNPAIDAFLMAEHTLVSGVTAEPEPLKPAQPLAPLPPGSTAAAVALLVVGATLLASCAALNPSGKAWDSNQIAFFELNAATAAENVAQGVETGGGLSPQVLAAIKAGGASLSASIQAQVAVLTSSGSTASQLEAAGLSGLVPAVNNLGTILTASSAGNTASPQAIALTAGISELKQLPALIGVVTELDNGYEPTPADMSNATAALTAAAQKL